MTKEEILEKHYPHYDIKSGWIFDGAVEDVFKAMQEYADQQSRIAAIDFFKWYGVKMVGFIEYIKDIRPTVTSDEIEEKIKEFEGKSFDDLFTLYLEEKAKQK